MARQARNDEKVHSNFVARQSSLLYKTLAVEKEDFWNVLLRTSLPLDHHATLSKWIIITILSKYRGKRKDRWNAASAVSLA